MAIIRSVADPNATVYVEPTLDVVPAAACPAHARGCYRIQYNYPWTFTNVWAGAVFAFMWRRADIAALISYARITYTEHSASPAPRYAAMTLYHGSVVTGGTVVSLSEAVFPDFRLRKTFPGPSIYWLLATPNGGASMTLIANSVVPLANAYLPFSASSRRHSLTYEMGVADAPLTLIGDSALGFGSLENGTGAYRCTIDLAWSEVNVSGFKGEAV